MEWQRHYDARNWEAIENRWRRSDDIAAINALLTSLKCDVPKRTLRNGVDEHEEFLRAKDAPIEWAGAAAILELGELEAKIAPDPGSDAELWADQQFRLAAELMTFVDSVEVTEGDSLLSRSAHAERALAALDRVKKIIELRVGLYEADERDVLREFAADVAINALRAGYFSHAAESKSIQSHAVRGMVTLESAAAGGRSRARETKPKTEVILKRMGELMEAKPRSISDAAKLARKEGLGTSWNANRQLWKNHRTK